MKREEASLGTHSTHSTISISHIKQEANYFKSALCWQTKRERDGQRGEERERESRERGEECVWHLVGHFAIVVLTVLQAVANTCLESRHSTEEVGVARPTACGM